MKKTPKKTNREPSQKSIKRDTNSNQHNTDLKIEVVSGAEEE